MRRGGIADRLPHGSGLGITQHLVRLFRAGAGTTVEGEADGTEGSAEAGAGGPHPLAERALRRLGGLRSTSELPRIFLSR